MSSDTSSIKLTLLIKKLKNVQGEGTSLITFLIPANSQLSKASQKLTEELGTAKNIKSHTNQQSVLTAIATAQNKLKGIAKCPPNGLALFCGIGMTPEGKEKKLSLCIEPPKLLATSLYMCDKKFHIEALEAMTREDKTYGFIIVDGHGVLFATLSGSNKTILQKFEVDLPPKHNKGGQSSVRFQRLGLEARKNYLTKMSELSTRWFIEKDQVNVDGLIIAGSAEFKKKLNQSSAFDPRLKAKVLNIVDIAYGGENGLNQAIELSKDILQNVRYVQEKKILIQYFHHISRDENLYVFGEKQTIDLLKQGCIKHLIVWENYEEKKQEIKDDEKGIYDKTEYDSLIEWLVDNASSFGAELILISENTPEGTQFVTGFGGIGGILQYSMIVEPEEIEINTEQTEDEFI